jgi:hypothetical protein
VPLGSKAASSFELQEVKGKEGDFFFSPEIELLRLRVIPFPVLSWLLKMAQIMV